MKEWFEKRDPTKIKNPKPHATKSATMSRQVPAQSLVRPMPSDDNTPDEFVENPKNQQEFIELTNLTIPFVRFAHSLLQEA